MASAWGTSWGTSWADAWAAGVPAAAVAAAAGGESNAKRKRKARYPRRVYYNGSVFVVKNADEERALLVALQEQAAIYAAVAQTPAEKRRAERARVRIARRVGKVDERQSQWLARLLAEDEELLLLAS